MARPKMVNSSRENGETRVFNPLTDLAAVHEAEVRRPLFAGPGSLRHLKCHKGAAHGL